jgi:hypothetical protein
MQKSTTLASIMAVALLACASAQAQVRVEDPWVRSTVAQQKTTGAFMAITSVGGGKLVDASTPVATSVEVHEMKMAGDVMKMRQIDALPLPPGVRVELKPGLYHMMLLGLKAPVKAGDVVPIKLVVEDAQGKRATVDVKAVARNAN